MNVGQPLQFRGQGSCEGINKAPDCINTRFKVGTVVPTRLTSIPIARLQSYCREKSPLGASQWTPANLSVRTKCFRVRLTGGFSMRQPKPFFSKVYEELVRTDSRQADQSGPRQEPGLGSLPATDGVAGRAGCPHDDSPWTVRALVWSKSRPTRKSRSD